MNILVLNNRGNECSVHFFHLSLCVVMFAVFFLKDAHYLVEEVPCIPLFL